MTIQRIFSDQEALEQFKETHPQFNSAQQIAAVPESEFVECYAEYFADGKKQARRVHQLAVSIQQRTALAWANIRAAVSPALQQAPFNNLPPSFLDHQESIPNYQQIFNNLDFLECDPCRSVLSPAAYFVDIMRFVDDNITQRSDGTVPANTIPANLTLRSRRPDLFSLSLDCDNTFSLVPYIDLVNEVLEGLVTNTRQQDAITVLDTEVFPLNLPLNLPLEEIRGYLDQVDLSLEQVYETFDRETAAGESVNEAAVARETLSLSPTELELCQTETLTPAELTQRYGLDAGADLLTALQNVPTFLEQTGLTRQELNDLLYQDLSQTEVTVGLSRLFFVNRADDGLGYLDIKQGPADATDPRRPPQETILNLSLAKLDRIYRFIKLARKLGWTFKELDWALRSLQPSHIAEQVLQFDGINDHVAVTDITVLDRSTLTIEAWVNPSQHRPNPIISKGQASDHRLQFMLWVDAEGRLAFYDQFQDGTAATPITPRSERSLPTGVFSHIAVTINGPTLQFYINGELDQTVTLAQSPQIVGSELNIGRDLNDTSFAGLIADVRVWATVRSASEIQAALYQRFTGQEADLLAYWPLTASVSDLIEDRTPNANHGVLGSEEFVTQPTWVQADLVLDTLPAQLGPAALSFNGTDQFLARQGVSGLGLTALTLEAWILVESVEDSIIFAWDNAAENLTRIEFGINTQGQLRFRSDAVNSGVAYLSQESVVANTLSHVVVTVAEGAVHFYINGDFSSSVAASAPPAFQIPGANDGDQLFIGRGLNGGYFHGRIAEVRLWNVVRTNDQLEIYRHRRVPGRSPHLIGYWPLTQVETEGTVLDASSNQNHLALGGVLGDFQPQRLTVDLALPTPPIEVPGTVLSFDGDNDVIAIGQPRKSLGLGAFEKITIEFWFKPADIANRSSNTQLLYTHGDAEAGLSIYCVDQQVYCVIWTANYERTTVQETVWVSDVIIAPDQWHHVAVVNDESPTLDLIEFHAYLNGQELGFDSSTHSNAALSNNQKAYHLSPVGAAYLGGMNRRGVTRIKGDYIEGEAHYQHYFAGAITDFRWWKTARSAADIEQQRYGAPALTDGDLLVYGPMAEGEGLTIINRAVAAEGSHGEQKSEAKKSEASTGYVAPGKQTGQSPLDVPASGELQQRNITVFNRDTQATFEQTYAHYQPNGVDVLTWSNYEYRGRLYIAATDGGIGVTVYNRFVEGSDRFYRLWRHPLQPTFVLSSRDSGRESLTGTLDSGVTPEPGSWYRFAVQIQTGADATTLRAKIWLGNTDEPDFQMEAVDASPTRLTSGTVGLWSFGAGQKHFDDLKLALLNPDGTVQDQRLLDENFESYRVDVNPADWVGTVDRPNYITDADIFQVTTVPETVVLGIDGNNDTAHAYYGPPSGNDPGTWTHYEYQGRIYIAEPDSGGGVTFFNQILQRNELIAYRMGRPAGPNETFQLLEDRSNDISYTPRASQLDSGLVPTAQTWYWFRIVVRSFLPEESGRNRPHTAIQAKVWEDGTPEPLAFQMTAEDNAGILESGTVGVYAETADAVYFNNLQVTRITTLANQATTEDVIRLFDGDLTTELNQLPSNWLNLADSTNDSFKTILVQTQALATLDTAENLYSHYQPDGPDGVDVLPWQNYTYSGKVYVGEAASNVGVTVYSRFPEQQDHFYRLSRSQQRPELHLDAHPADILTLNQSGSSNDVPVVTNAWYWFRIAVQSTTASGEAQTRIRAKVWMDGSLEPEEFQLDTTDNSRLRSSAGTVGVWAGGPGLKAFDNLRVTTGATDLFFDNFESYRLNQHPTDWRDTTVRSLFEADLTLLRTSDIGFNLPRWQSIPDVPLLRHPLNRRALGFDGARQYLAASAGGTLGALTLEAWVTVSQQQVAPILAGRDRISNHTFWVGLNNSGQVIVNLQTDQTQTVAGNQSLAVAELTHVALTIDDTTVTIYVDGVVDAQVELSVPFVLTVSDIEVGRDFGSQYFAGTLRDLRLWNMARGPETFAISQRYQQLPLEDRAGQSLVGSLVGYWPFPETEGNLTVDVSGNGNDLRLGGLVGDRHPVPTFAPNLPDFWQNRQTFCLTAANQHLSFSSSEDDLGVLQRRTIEVWFKVDDPYITRRKQVLYVQGDDQRGLVIYIHDGYLFFGGYNRPQDESCWEGTWLCSDRIKPGQWHHAALVLDGRADVRPYGLQGYLDGKLADTGPGAQLDRHQAAFTLGGLNTTIPFHDGSSSAEQPHWFAGEILELRIWDTALAPEIIRDNHNQSLASNAPPLALWWTFDDITASQRIVADRSTNDQSFTLANDAVVKALVSQPGYQLPTLLLNAVTLKDLATLRQLQSRYQLSMDRLTALWFEVEHTGTADGITLFDRLFNPTDLTRDPWPYYIHPPLRWDVSGRELPSRDRALRSRLMAALQVSSSDLDQAVAYLSTATETPVELTTSYLNQLYRLTQLPKTLRLSLPEFFRLLQLLGIADIESIQTVGDVKRISDRVQEMQAIGITVAELDFFANDIESPAITVTPEDTALRTLADDLANQAVDLLIQPTALVTDDINDAQALALLAYLRRNNLIQDLGLTVAEFDNFTVVSPNYTGVTDIPLTALGAATVLDWRQAFVAFEAQLRREVRSSGGGNGQPINIAEARRETGAANLPQFEVIQPLIDNGVITAEGVVLQTQVPNGILAADLSTLAQRVTDFLAQQHALQQRIQTVLDETLTRSRTEHANAILANLAELFNANPDTMQVLIDYLASTLVPLITPVVLTQWLLTISSNPETTPIPAAASGYFYRLGKLNALVNEFSFTVSETRALLANPGDFGVSNVFNPTLDDLARLYTFTQLKQDFDDPNGTLSDQLVAFLQLDNPTTEAPASPLANSLYKAILDIAVIWDPLQLQGTIAYFGNDLLLKPDSGVSHRVEGLRQLQQAFAQAEILRIQVTTLIALANTRTLTLEFYQTQAAILLNLLRALYSDEEWPQVYRPIRDPLAILKRDALLGIAMQDIDFPSQFEGRRSADLLYEYLLLDVQVSSEVETSRIVQAIASVQLYVQRCLLSLESGVNALGIPTQQWDWMRNYRVWEANRKVFLYPESYIEPELRDTKTPFFEELEQELMQSNIDQDAVEQAYSNYLNKFIEVANLKIVGSYLHREPGDPLSEGTLYLIGRTETEPITYYYRTRQGSDRWLPWEKIDLGINGTIATPVFAFGRLFLFWIEFSESSESIPSASASNSSENDSVTVFEPTLRFSHLNVNGGWLQPQTYQLVQTVADLPTVRDAIANVTTAYNASQTQISTLSNTQISASNLLNVLNQSRNVADQIDALSGVLVLISPRSRQEQTTLNQVADNLKQIAKNIRTSIDNVSTEYSAITTIFLFRPFFNSIFSNSILNAVITAWIAAIDQAQDAVSNALVTLSSIQVDALRLTPEEQQQFGWQRVYAQQVVEFAPTSPANEREDNARVLAVSKATVLQQSLPTISMNALTIEFWVNLANPNPNGTRTNATSTIEVLNYESNRLVVGVTTVQTSIPGVENAINGAIAAANQTRTLLDNTADATNLPTAAAVQTEVRAVIRQAQQAVTLATTLQTEDVSGQESRSANLLNRAQSLLQELQNLDNDNADTVLTRIQETSRRDALLLASNRLHSNSRNDDATDTQLRFQTLTANVEVSGVSGLSIVGSIDLNYNQWHHVAITLSAVSANAYTVEVYRDGVSQRQGQLANGLTANGSLTIAQQLDSDAQTRLTAQLSDVRLWSVIRAANDIQTQRSTRQSEQAAGLALYYPLNRRTEGATLDIVRSTLDFTVVPEFTALNSRNQRERIILFYGNQDEIIRTRRNNQDDQGFSLTLSAQNQQQFDLTLAPTFELYIGQNQSLITDNFVDAGVTAQNALLQSLTPNEVSVRDVHNQPGWYVVDTGDEQFLVEGNPQQGQLDSAGDRINLTYGNITGSGRQPVSIQFSQEEALATTGGLPTFEFVRLSTFAAYDLSVNLFRNGLDGLLTLEAQRTPEILFSTYQPNSQRVIPPPQYISGLDTIDFNGVNGGYYWEVFFHIPFFIANQLNANQSFADAQRWYHYIFDPTQQGVGSDRYWRFLPFRAQQLDTLAQLLLVTDPSDPGLARFREVLEIYRQDPFDPHAIARLRINAYQKAIVMKYIDNLLDWGDSLFIQDTRESVNEAAQLYVLAFNLLGPRPEARASRPFEAIGDYNGIETSLTDIPDFITDLNRPLPPLPIPQNGLVLTTFCVPENPDFLAYWDRVEDRLFKIRHSLNIEGIFRQQALFQPPLDVRALVQAAAAGNRDIGSLLADVNRAVPHYRYAFMLDQAKGMIDVVKELGGALLEALETRDDKALSGLEHTHAQTVRKMMTSIREGAIAEAKANIEALTISKQRSENRKQHFDDLISTGLSGEEIAQLVLSSVSQVLKTAAGLLKSTSSALEIAPDLIVGGAGISSPVTLTLAGGGSKLAESVSDWADGFEIVGDLTALAGEVTGKVGEYKRRAQDWRLEQQTANFDVQEIEVQIAIAQSELATAEQELLIHQTEIAQSDEVAAFNRSKFTNSQLYSWLSSRLAGLYFQSYRLAYDFAKAAERALQYELPTNERFINFGHWDSLRRGLLAGESLLLDINRMEKFHLDNDSRFQEIEKTISMKRTFPVEFITLVTTGVCDFQLTERLFNQDYPGHYFRVIKSMALTVNANNVQPYQTINATLTQLGNKALLDPDIGAVRYLMGDESAATPDASVLRVDWRSNQQIAVSTTTTRDDGMFGSFDLNFVFDDRYFPFEGTGAVSAWNLEIPLSTNPDLVDNDQGVSFLDIDDIIIHLRYTSKYDRGAFKQAVEAEVNKPII